MGLELSPGHLGTCPAQILRAVEAFYEMFRWENKMATKFTSKFTLRLETLRFVLDTISHPSVSRLPTKGRGGNST